MLVLSKWFPFVIHVVAPHPEEPFCIFYDNCGDDQGPGRYQQLIFGACNQLADLINYLAISAHFLPNLSKSFILSNII